MISITRRAVLGVLIMASVLMAEPAGAFFSPIQGRWLSRDPIGEQGGFSLYVAFGNDPIRSFDYLGLACEVCDITRRFGVGESTLELHDLGIVAGTDPRDPTRRLHRVGGTIQYEVTTPDAPASCECEIFEPYGLVEFDLPDLGQSARSESRNSTKPGLVDTPGVSFPLFWPNIRRGGRIEPLWGDAMVFVYVPSQTVRCKEPAGGTFSKTFGPVQALWAGNFGTFP